MTTRLIATLAAALVCAAPALAGEVVAKGDFVGKSRHETRGAAMLEKEGDRWMVRLGADFYHDGAPDPKVALGRDGVRKDAILAPLEKLEGAQSYALPEGLDGAAFNEVWIWCERFDVPLGQAKLN